MAGWSGRGEAAGWGRDGRRDAIRSRGCARSRKSNPAATSSGSIHDLLPRIERSVQQDRAQLEALLPHLTGGMKAAVEENLSTTVRALTSIAGLADAVRDQSDLLGLARHRAPAAARPKAPTVSGPPAQGALDVA